MVQATVTEVDALLERAQAMVRQGLTLQAAARLLAEEMDERDATIMWRQYGPQLLYSLLESRLCQRRASLAAPPRAQPPDQATWARERAAQLLEMMLAYVDETGRRRHAQFGDMGYAEVQGVVESHLQYASAHRREAQRFARFLPYLEGGRRVRDLPPEVVVALYYGEA